MTTFLSVCSGIEAASVAFTPLGWRPVGFSEIEAFPSAVLAHWAAPSASLRAVGVWRSSGFPQSTARTLQNAPFQVEPRIPWRGKPAEECPDGPRYKALGNSWAVPCVRWIAARIDAELNRLDSSVAIIETGER